MNETIILYVVNDMCIEYFVTHIKLQHVYFMNAINTLTQSLNYKQR